MITLKNLYDSIGQTPRNGDVIDWIRVDKATKNQREESLTLHDVLNCGNAYLYKMTYDDKCYCKISDFEIDAYCQKITIKRNGNLLYPFEPKGDKLSALKQALDYSGAKYAYLVGEAIDKLIDEKIAKSKGESK